MRELTVAEIVATAIRRDGSCRIEATDGRDLQLVQMTGNGQVRAALDERLNRVTNPDLAVGQLMDGRLAVYGRGVLMALEGNTLRSLPVPFHARPVTVAGSDLIHQAHGPDSLVTVSGRQRPGAPGVPVELTAPWIAAGWFIQSVSIDPATGRIAVPYRSFGPDDAVLEQSGPADRTTCRAVCTSDNHRIPLRQVTRAGPGTGATVPRPSVAGRLFVAGPAHHQVGFWLRRAPGGEARSLIVVLRGGPSASVLPDGYGRLGPERVAPGADVLLGG